MCGVMKQDSIPNQAKKKRGGGSWGLGGVPKYKREKNIKYLDVT